MSHDVGTVQPVTPVITLGPDAGPPSAPNTWKLNFPWTPAPSGTKLVILHFANASLPASNRLEVDLGYDTDVFTSADGPEFWTRPVNTYAFADGKVPIRYITNGASTGSVQLDKYGRGERHAGLQDPAALSNCDPFLIDPSYTEPIYDPWWFCSPPPNWENIACVTTPGDVRTWVARGVGLILHVDNDSRAGGNGDYLSTCTVTLVGPDIIITAGHCVTSPVNVASASVTFDYQVNCDGTRPASYAPRFFKVKDLIKQRYADGTLYDYCLMHLKVPPGGLGIPPIQMRHDLPALGEQVFGIHHPNAAVKKVSIPHPGFDTVIGSGPNAVNVPSDFHVSGGSSGSGLFDVAGRIVGVLSNGDPCGRVGSPRPLIYFPTATILPDVAAPGPPPVTRDVMLVFDRSGSMSLPGASGRSKIEEARDAASLFVQLIRSATGNRLGLVSFSTKATDPVDFALAGVTSGSKTTLIGPAPYSGGLIGGLAPGGSTTIGGGLNAAYGQLQMGTNPRSVLLFTDGLQNTPPMVNPSDTSPPNINVNAIGYGTEASLDGVLLTAVAMAHNGTYVRADTSLQLEKYFAQAFGNIFEAGLLMDPEFDLPQDQESGPSVPFAICEEENVTVVVGWDNVAASLLVDVTTPLGATVSGASPGVEQATGRTWSFLRIPLPQHGERDGTWKVNVFRPGGGGEFPPPAPALRYFVNVVANGGALLRRMPDDASYYTGDVINPLVGLQYRGGGMPPKAKVRATVLRPDASLGNMLSQSKLAAPITLDADTIPARQATMLAIEKKSGKPVVGYTTQTFDLFDDPEHTKGALESGGLFGNELKDLLTLEGNYTFHVQASYGDKCTATRELLWSLHVDVGIDPVRTSTTTTVAGACPDGTRKVNVVLVPRDRYGNNLGPGRLDGLSVTGAAGNTVTGLVRDNGDGSYTVDLCWDQQVSATPGVVITQPGRPPVGIPLPVPEGVAPHVYSVKFVCGVQTECGCHAGPVRPGAYATEINILNDNDTEVTIVKHVIPVVFAGAAAGREPRFAGRKASDRIVLPPHTATMDDCRRLSELLLGGPPEAELPLTVGFLEILSSRPLQVTAVYTVSDLKSGSVSMDVVQVQGREK
jgi:hypothetical protein